MPDFNNPIDNYEKFRSWSDTEPQYGMHPYPMPHFSASLHVGSTILIERQSFNQYNYASNERNMIIGRIISFCNDSTGNVQVVVNIFVPFQETHLCNTIFPTNERRLKYVTEVVQTHYKIEVAANEIYDICFIFTINNLASTGNTFCEGIKNAYYIRYRLSLDDMIHEEIDIDNYYCFPSLFPGYYQYGPCYISRIWNMIRKVQKIMSGILNIKSQKQSTFIRRNVSLSIEFEQWQYIYNHSWRNATLDRIRQSSKKEMTTYQNLSRQTFVSSSSGVHLRFETKHHLVSFTNIFGSTTVGVRSKMPPVGRSDTINIGATINIIQGSNTREIPFKKNTERNGIDFSFTFDKFNFVTLVIGVRYAGILYRPTLTTNDFKNDSVILNSFRSTINNISCPPVAADSNVIGNCKNVMIGQHFRNDNNEIFVVLEVTSTFVRAKRFSLSDPTELEILQTDLELVSRLINDYNNHSAISQSASL